jgi:hypothetical protein
MCRTFMSCPIAQSCKALSALCANKSLLVWGVMFPHVNLQVVVSGELGVALRALERTFLFCLGWQVLIVVIIPIKRTVIFQLVLL